MQSLTEPCQLPLVDVASEPAELLAPDKRTAPAILKALKGLFDQVSLSSAHRLLLERVRACARNTPATNPMLCV